MTCIIGIKTSKGVLLGGDSCTSIGHKSIQKSDPKVKKKGEYLFGGAGCVRTTQVMTEIASNTKVNDKDDFFAHVLRTLIPELKKALNEHGCLKEKEGKQMCEGSMIVAYKKRMVVIYHNFAAIEHIEDFAAIGCGDEYAIGCMYGIMSEGSTARQKVTKALDAASRYSNNVSPPYTFVDNYS